MAQTLDRIVLDGFTYTVEDHVLHAEGQRPAPCKRLTFIDEPRALQIEAWFSPEAWERFQEDVAGGALILPGGEPTGRLGV